VSVLQNVTSRDGLSSTIADVPHFLGIGAPRCGTSWVFKMLRLHPQVWLPWKEMHFFDSMDPETDSGYDIRSRALRLRQGWSHVLRRLAMRSTPGAQALARRFFPLQAIQAPSYRWTTNYLFGDVSLDWYQDLFSEGRAAGLICGEITPAYFMLSEHGIADLARTLPRVRAFLLLRNPLEWAWSGLCKDVRDQGGDPRKMSEDELIAWCPVPTGRGRLDFGSNLHRWLANFPRERLLVGFHDEIRSDPAAFLTRLCEFIGASPYPSNLNRLMKSRVNSSAHGTAMPRGVKRYVAEQYRSETAIVAELVGGPAQRWWAEIESVLQRG
jgi:hypothetical protein